MPEPATVHQESPSLATVLAAWQREPEGTPYRFIVIRAEYLAGRTLRAAEQSVPIDRVVGASRPTRVLDEHTGHAIASLGSIHDTRRVEVSWWLSELPSAPAGVTP